MPISTITINDTLLVSRSQEDMVFEVESVEETEIAIGSPAVSEISQTYPDSNFVSGKKALAELGETLLEYHTKIFKNRMITHPDFEKQLDEWNDQLLTFGNNYYDNLSEEGNDSTLALIYQNFSLIFYFKWHLCHGDPNKSFTIGHYIFHSSLRATVKWMGAEHVSNAVFCCGMVAKFEEYLNDSADLLEDVSGIDREQLKEEQFAFLVISMELSHWKGDLNEVKSYLGRLKEMLGRPNQLNYLTALTYNFSVDTYGKKDLENSLFWLKESCQFCDDSADLKLKLNVYKLTGETYLQMNPKMYWQNAGSAFEMAFSITPESGIIVSQTKCVLSSGKTIFVKQFLDESLFPKINILERSDAEKILELMMNAGQTALALLFLSQAVQEGKISVTTQIVTTLRADKAKDAACLLEVNVERLTFDDDHNLRRLLVKRALEAITLRQGAEKWMTFLHKISINSADSANRNRHEDLFNSVRKQLCYIYSNNGNYNEAIVIWSLLKIDQYNRFDIFLQMKMSLLENKEEDFLNLLSKLADTAMGLHYDNAECPVVVLACAAAIQADNGKILEVCMKKVLAQKKVKSVVHLSSHQYLTRLLLHSQSQMTVLEVKERIREVISVAQSLKNVAAKERNAVILWYEKVFWSLAIRRQPKEMYDIMLGCCQLLEETDQNDPIALTRRNYVCCLTITKGLDIVRHGMMTDHDGEINQKCLDLCNRLESGRRTGNFTRFDRIIYLYKFEANCNYESLSKLEKMWEQIKEEKVDLHFHKTLMAILIESGTQYVSLLIEITISCIVKGFQQEIQEESVKLTRFLLKLLLESNDVEDAKIYKYLEQLVECVCRFQNRYSFSELEFMALSCWNYAVTYLFREKQLPREKWFLLVLKLARQTALSGTKCYQRFIDLFQETKSLLRDNF